MKHIFIHGANPNKFNQARVFCVKAFHVISRTNRVESRNAPLPCSGDAEGRAPAPATVRHDSDVRQE